MTLRRRVDPGTQESAAERRRTGRAARARARAVAGAAGLVIGYALDASIGQRRGLGPVAGYQRLASTLVRPTESHDLAAGLRPPALRSVGIAVGVPVAVAGIALVVSRNRPLLRTAVVAAATWSALGGGTIRRESTHQSTLDTAEAARGAVEFVAAGTADHVVGPLVWGAVAGAPGMLGYRAVGALNEVLRRASEGQERGLPGTLVARVDDLAKVVPSRFTAMLTVAAAPIVGGSPGRAAWAWLRDGHRHPELNAGQSEAAMAGALDVRLEPVTVHSGQTPGRAGAGADLGRDPSADDVRRAATLSRAVGVAALVLCAGHVLARPWRARRRAAHRR